MKKKILSALCLVLSMVLLTGCGLKELLTTWVPDYSQYESDYDEIQLTIKKNLENYTLHNSYELDALLNIQGVKNSVIIK